MIHYSEIVFIENGAIKSPRKKLAESFKKLKDGKYFLTLEKFYKKRSTQQNRSKFGIAYKILQSCFIQTTGESISIEWVHEFCKERFLPAEYVEKLKEEYLQRNRFIVNNETGEEIEIPLRLTTTKLSTVQEIEYYKNMQKFCAEFFNTEIPDPDSSKVKKKL
jgi:hypothetical protein